MMKGNLISRALCVAAAVLGAILAIGVMTFASACVHDDGTVSACHAAQIAVAATGAAIVVLSVAALFMKSPKAAGITMLVAAVGGLFAAFCPGNAFPLCMMETMRCHVVFQPFAQFAGIAIAAVAIIAGIRSLRARS